MGWLRKIIWISSGLIIGITALTMFSKIYLEGLGWTGINLKIYIFLYIFGSSFILSMFIYDIISYYLLRSNVHRLMGETEKITPEEIAKILREPLWRVNPIFRKRDEIGILIVQSGKYMHFNENFEQKFLEQYSENLTNGELAHHFNLSKNEITLIIDELKYKEILPELEAHVDRSKKEVSTKGLRKAARIRKKHKKKR